MVGANAVVINCHKVLLSFFSDFFHRFQPAFPQLLGYQFPNDNPPIIQEFVNWLYTGRLNYNEEAVKKTWPEWLWLWGSMVNCPRFSNEAMHLLFAKYKVKVLTAAMTRWVYTNTPPGSELRLLVAGIIGSEGPFSRHSRITEPERTSFRSDWKALLGLGGDVVTDNIENGFNCYKPLISPLLSTRHDNYLHPYDEKSATTHVQAQALAAKQEQKKSWSCSWKICC